MMIQNIMKHQSTSILLASICLPLQLLAQKNSSSIPRPTQGKKLEEVTVSVNSVKRKLFIESAQMGKTDLPVSMLLKAPAIGGEQDIIKALQLTPGVKQGTEGSIGMYVRGGGNDENLIMLDGATIYNAGHLLGFFSLFNNTTLKEAQLYKSSFPAQYGGRMSSVLDVRTKDASLQDYHTQVNIGTITSSANVQLPVVKDKVSLMLAGRRTYIDKVMKSVPYYFYDLNGKLVFKANERNRFYLSSYYGDDVLRSSNLNSKNEDQKQIATNMKMGNKVWSAKWNRLSANNLLAYDLNLSYSNFKYLVDGRADNNILSVRSAIRDYNGRYDVRYAGINGHKITSGIHATYHYFNPNIVNTSGPQMALFTNSTGKKIYNTEAAVYVNDEITINDKYLLTAGMRLSGMTTGSKNYINPEPRIGFKYSLSEESSLKLSYARMTQYLHLVSSSSLALPTDLWYPVTDNIKPGISDQLSIGYYHTIPSMDISISTELYYKRMQNLLEYKEGALLVMNNDYEKELVHGCGEAYGAELFVSKTAGRFTGWLGYTLSFATRRFDSLNGGKQYYARYDRRHDLSLVAMYDITPKWSISTTWIYATGSPFTGQVSQYIVPSPGLTGVEVLPAYTGRNELRLSASFRTDMDLQYKFKVSKRVKADAHLSVYNVFNRTQPYTVQRVTDEKNNGYKYQQKGLFGTITAASLNISL